jgi:glucokinase
MPEKERLAIGVDLGGTNIKLGLVSKAGKIIEKTSVITEAEKGPEKVVKNISKGIDFLISKANVKIKGIGIGFPGVVSTKKGMVENPPNLPGWKKVFLGKIIQKKFRLPTYVENDANAAAIGEMIFGAGKNYDSFIMITLGTGVGGGIVLNKKIYRGQFGAAGEIGHISIDFEGRKCNCGSYGCIEAYAGNNYLKEIVNNDLKDHPESKLWQLVNDNTENITPMLIQKAAEMNDHYAKSVVKDLGVHLGVAFASMSNILDVSTFIIGGGVAGFGKPLFDSIKETMTERVLSSSRKRIKVIPAKLKNEAGIKGASALVFYRS